MTEHKTKPLTLRVPMSLHERLAAMAEKDRRSLNAEAIVLLDAAMSKREAEEKHQPSKRGAQ